MRDFIKLNILYRHWQENPRQSLKLDNHSRVTTDDSSLLHCSHTHNNTVLICHHHLSSSIVLQEKIWNISFAISVCYSTNIVKQWQLPADVSVLWHNCRLSISNENFSDFNSRFQTVPMNMCSIKSEFSYNNDFQSIYFVQNILEDMCKQEMMKTWWLICWWLLMNLVLT